MAWLLATSRILAEDPEIRHRENFVHALRATGLTVDNSRISRWESGNQVVAPVVITAYESVLGLAEGSLLAVAQGLYRSLDPSAALRREPIPSVGKISDVDLDTIFDLIDRREATGAHWLQMAGDLSLYDRVYLHPQTWASLCTRLVTELCRSVGASHVRRYEACATLISHPAAQRHMTRAIGSHVMHPDVQIVDPALNLLTEISDAAAGDLTLRLMESENLILRRGAFRIAPTKVGRGHFRDPRDLAKLEAHAIKGLRHGDDSHPKLDVIDLATQLPDLTFERISGKVRNSRIQSRLESAKTSGELLPGSITRAIARGLATSAQTGTPGQYATEPDLMLQRLVLEALFHAHRERRRQAAILIAASPYAAAVAHCCLEIVRDPNEFISMRGWALLMKVGSGRRHDDLVHHAMRDAQPGMQSRALIGLGLSRLPLGAKETASVVKSVASEAVDRVRYSAMFALGMTGSDELEGLTRTEDEWTSRTARWWMDIGPAVRDADDLTRLVPAPSV